jgi:hypothetical protein
MQIDVLCACLGRVSWGWPGGEKGRQLLRQPQSMGKIRFKKIKRAQRKSHSSTSCFLGMTVEGDNTFDAGQFDKRLLLLEVSDLIPKPSFSSSISTVSCVQKPFRNSFHCCCISACVSTQLWSVGS